MIVTSALADYPQSPPLTGVRTMMSSETPFAQLLALPSQLGSSNLLPAMTLGGIAFDAGLFSQGPEAPPRAVSAIGHASVPAQVSANAVGSGASSQQVPPLDAQGLTVPADNEAGGSDNPGNLEDVSRSGRASLMQAQSAGLKSGTEPGPVTIVNDMPISSPTGGAPSTEEAITSSPVLSFGRIPDEVDAQGGASEPAQEHVPSSALERVTDAEPGAETALSLTETDAGPMIAYFAPHDIVSWPELKSIAEGVMAQFAISSAKLSYKAKIVSLGVALQERV